MPCRDYYDDHPEQYFKDVTEPALKKQVSFAESALCQTLAAFQKYIDANIALYLEPKSPLDFIDFDEAGITRRDLEVWWINHMQLDAKHREEERIRNLKRSALGKLTDAEKKVLGL